MKSDNTQDRICQAAIRTVIRDGMLAMTLDNVAKEAGVSKGGVMYHFSTKEQLVTATLTYYAEQAERMLMTRIANDPQPRRRWARAMLSCLFPDTSSAGVAAEQAFGTNLSPEILQKFMLAVLAAAVNNPGIFEPLRQLGKRLRERLLSDPEDGLDQLLIWLAVDGLFLWQFVGLIDVSDPLFQKIGDTLRAQTSAPAETPQRHGRRKVAVAAELKSKGSRRGK
jgi:AcrR family transcriptional regulator